MSWIATHLFHYNHPLVYMSGSGDKAFDWVTVFFLLTLAIAATCVWSILDRRRAHYEGLYKWFRVFLRFAVAGQMIGYGVVKIFPMQMPFPPLAKLLERFGDFSPMGILWYSVGASPAYERFVGSAEIVAGVLLIVPATSMLGALICLVDMIQVLALNMTYDVPVKLFSLHLVLMAMFLLLPERLRLVRMCLLDCAVGPSTAQKLYNGRRANRIATAVQVVFGLLLVAGNLYSVQKWWRMYGGGAPKSPLYGIWNVDEMAVDGVVRLPLVTDWGRWRRVIFDDPQTTIFQRMDDAFAGFGTSLDQKGATVMVNLKGSPRWQGQLAVQRHGPDAMTLDGHMGQHAVHMRLSLMDRKKFLLVSRGFHWVQDYPFNR
jgi:uncharacterized membrane protein YphA (DoxX/SURF4 family)